jgi:hypothetical protein
MNAERKKEAIEIALSKLTEEEKVLLGLNKADKPPRIKQNYKLKINYMIGDSNGYTDEERKISLNNPFIKLVTGALDKIVTLKGTWGIVFDDQYFDRSEEAGNISEMENQLLSLISNYNYTEDAVDILNFYGFDVSDENHEHLKDFDGLLIRDTEYSFLVYLGYKLS